MTCPEYIVALLCRLEEELDRVMWNIYQEDYDSPFRNTGNEFKNDVFEVRAYYWGDDEEEMEKPNFRCGDLEITWYKRLGRDTQINKRISFKKMEDIFCKCLISIWQYEYEHSEDSYLTQPDAKELMKTLKGYRKVSWWQKLKLKHKLRKWSDPEDSI